MSHVLTGFVEKCNICFNVKLFFINCLMKNQSANFQPISLFKGVRIMVFNATLNNYLFISWRSVLLVNKTGIPGENHRTAASH